METKLTSALQLDESKSLGNRDYVKFCPRVRYLSEISRKEWKYIFKAYLPFDLVPILSFESLHEAAEIRRDMINRILEYRGKDQVIFPNGLNGDLGLISKISDVTEIFTKDSRSGFSITIASAPYPLHFVFSDKCRAEYHRTELCAIVESCRRQRFRIKTVANV